MDSMVVIFLPAAWDAGVKHERIGAPSKCTVQAPQSAMPQPNLVPVMPRWSRSTHNNGVSGAASVSMMRLLTLSFVMRRFRWRPVTAAMLASRNARDLDVLSARFCARGGRRARLCARPDFQAVRELDDLGRVPRISAVPLECSLAPALARQRDCCRRP